MKGNKLAASVLYLPIDQIDRIQLWLTYQEIKPASTILLPNPKEDEAGRRRKRVEKWMQAAQLNFARDKVNPRLVHVSKDKELIDKLVKIQGSQEERDILARGLAYGYPKEAVEIFAKSWKLNKGSKLMASNTEIDFALRGKYWRNYLVYAPRKTDIDGDARVAKSWADVIRRDVPLLARWYES